MTNCINCGAILRGDKCEYCGAEYKNNGISANFNTDDYIGTMNLVNEQIRVYINRMESNIICADSYKDSDGNLHRDKQKIKRTFTVIEI